MGRSGSPSRAGRSSSPGSTSPAPPDSDSRPPTPVPNEPERFIAVNWSFIPDSGVAALVASELRRSGQPFSNELMITRCRSMVRAIQDWIRSNQDYCAPVFSALMAHRAHIGVAHYNTWDTYVDSVGPPYRGRLDLLQLAAFADIQTVNIRVLAPEGDDRAWAPISWIQPADGAVRAAGCTLAVPLTVGLGSDPHDSFVELLPYPRRRRRSPSSSSPSDADDDTDSTEDSSGDSDDPADRTHPPSDSSTDSDSPAPPGRSPRSGSDLPTSTRMAPAPQLHAWVFASGAAGVQGAEDIPVEDAPNSLGGGPAPSLPGDEEDLDVDARPGHGPCLASLLSSLGEHSGPSVPCTPGDMRVGSGLGGDLYAPASHCPHCLLSASPPLEFCPRCSSAALPGPMDSAAPLASRPPTHRAAGTRPDTLYCMLPGMATDPRLWHWLFCPSCQRCLPRPPAAQAPTCCLCSTGLTPIPARTDFDCDALGIWTACDSCSQALCSLPDGLALTCPRAGCAGRRRTLRSLPEHLPSPPPACAELLLTHPVFPRRLTSPRPFATDGATPPTLGLARHVLHDGSFYCSVCLSAYASADVANALGRLVCCGQAIRPTPMAGDRECPRPTSVMCSFPDCAGICWDLARLAQDDGSPWRGGLHCGRIPVLVTPRRPAPHERFVPGHTGPHLPPTLRLASLPPLTLVLKTPACTRACSRLGFGRCLHAYPAHAAPGYADLAHWMRTINDRRRFLVQRHERAVRLCDADSLALQPSGRALVAKEQRLHQEHLGHFASLGSCPPPLLGQLDPLLPAWTPPGRTPVDWLLGETSRTSRAFCPQVDPQDITHLHCALWPWFCWKEWRSLDPHGHLATGCSWFCQLCRCPVTRSHLSSGCHLALAASPPVEEELWQLCAYGDSASAGYRLIGDSAVADYMRELVVRFPGLLRVALPDSLPLAIDLDSPLPPAPPEAAWWLSLVAASLGTGQSLPSTPEQCKDLEAGLSRPALGSVGAPPGTLALTSHVAGKALCIPPQRQTRLVATPALQAAPQVQWPDRPQPHGLPVVVAPYIRFPRRTDTLLESALPERTEPPRSRPTLQLFYCGTCGDAFLATPQTDDAACFTCLAAGHCLLRASLSVHPLRQADLLSPPTTPFWRYTGGTAALPLPQPVHCPLHLTSWSAAQGPGCCPVCQRDAVPGPPPPVCASARRIPLRHFSSLISAEVSTATPSTAAATACALQQGLPPLEGAHYLAPDSLGAIQARGFWAAAQAMQDEDAHYGPLPGRKGYYEFLNDSPSVGSCATMLLYYEAMASHLEATQPDADASRSRQWWHPDIQDRARQLTDAASPAASAEEPTDDTRVEIVVLYAGHTPLKLPGSSRASAKEERLTVSWNHPTLDQFGLITPTQLGPGFVIGTTSWATFSEATGGPRPQPHLENYTPSPQMAAWRRIPPSADHPDGWQRVDPYFRVDFHTVPVAAYRAGDAIRGLYYHEVKLTEVDIPPNIHPISASLGLQSLPAALLCGLLDASPPPGVGDPSARCTLCHEPMSIERLRFPGCLHPCHHACLLAHWRSSDVWLECPGLDGIPCGQRILREASAPPPQTPLPLPDATPLQRVMLDFQDAVAANTQPGCIWELFHRLCQLTHTFSPEPVTRCSFERALGWGHTKGESGPALVKFGWACLRHILLARGLAPSQVIGHTAWTPPAEYEFPPDTLPQPAAAGWRLAAADAQYQGPLAPGPEAARVHGGLLAPASLLPAPALPAFLDRLGSLNVLQTRAACVIRDSLLSLIIGPPGTGKTATLASTAVAWLLTTQTPVLICSYSHIAAETLMRRLLSVAAGQGLDPTKVTYLRDFGEGPADLWPYHAFRNAGLDKPLHRAAKPLLTGMVIRDIECRRYGIVVSTAQWTDYIRHRSPKGSGDPPSWRLPFGLVLVDEASQATEAHAAMALRWALLGGRAALLGDSSQLGPHHSGSCDSWHDAPESLMAHLGRRLGTSPQLKVVLCASYRAPASVMRVYSLATYDGELRSTPLCQHRCAPLGIAWPRLPPPTPRAGSTVDTAARLLESMRGAISVSDWLSHLPWTLLGEQGCATFSQDGAKDLRCAILDELRLLCDAQLAPARAAAAWAAQILTEQDCTPSASAWHLWRAMDAAMDSTSSFAIPRSPEYEQPEALSCEPLFDDDSLPPPALPPDTPLPSATGPRLYSSSQTQVPCASVATSLFVHLDSEESPACRSFVNFVEADAIVQLLLTHGRNWIREGYSVRILCTYLAQATLVKKALELMYSKASVHKKAHLNDLLNLPVSTVDSAQGTEADIVLASLVRANSRFSTGFVSDARRSNVLLSRARIAQFTFGHAPTLASSNWNDFPALFSIYENMGALLAAAPNHWWLPATVDEVTSRSDRAPLSISTPHLDDALASIVSKHGEELSGSPFAVSANALLTRLAGCTRDPLQVGREARERAGQATEPPPPPPQQQLDAALARCAALDEGQALTNLIVRAATAITDVMASAAFPPVLQHLASLQPSSPVPASGTPHQFDLKTLSHQGYFATQDLGRDPGNESLALAWGGLCLAAGIAIPIGRSWPSGRADWSCPPPLGPSRACLRHPAPSSGVAKAPGALANPLRERANICHLMRSSPLAHQSAYLIRHLCVTRERIIFPPTTDDHLSDAGDYIEAAAATVRPWNASIRKLTTSLLATCNLPYDEAESLHERLTRLLAACRELLQAAADIRVRALSTAVDPWHTLAAMVRRPDEPVGPERVAELLDSPSPPLRIDAPLLWIRDRLAAMEGCVTYEGNGCCLCAALAHLAPAPTESSPSPPTATGLQADPSCPPPLQQASAPPSEYEAPTEAADRCQPPEDAAAPPPRAPATSAGQQTATCPASAPAPNPGVSLSESDQSDAEARSPSASAALPPGAASPAASVPASARTDPGSLRREGSESRRRRRRRSQDRTFRHDRRQAREAQRSRTRAASPGATRDDPYGIFSAANSVASVEEPGGRLAPRELGRREVRRPRAPPPARSSSPRRRARSLSPRSSRRSRRPVSVTLTARLPPGASSLDNRLVSDPLARRITCDLCTRSDLLHDEGTFLVPALRAAAPHVQEQLAKEGAEPTWHCRWCWNRRLLGDDLSARAGSVAQSLILDKKPQSHTDNRFYRHFKGRQHTCDAPGCTRSGAASDSLGDWLFDQDNKERFRPENLCMDAAASGRVADRSTFRMRDPSHIPMASAPLPFPRLARNQPDDLSNLRCQLWWTARWNATWYCKYCISRRYSLNLTVLDDYLHRRSDKKRNKRFHRERKNLPDTSAGDPPPPEDAPAPAGAARVAPEAPPADSHLTLSLPFLGSPLRLSITSAPLTRLLFPAHSDQPGLSDSVVLDLAVGDRSRHHPFRRSLLALLRDSRGAQGRGHALLPPVRTGRASSCFYDFEHGQLHCLHVGAGSSEHDVLSGWSDAKRFAAELLTLGLTALAESNASRLLIPPLTVGRLRHWSARSGMLAADALAAAMAFWPPEPRDRSPLDLSGRSLVLVVDHRSIHTFRARFSALAEHLAAAALPSQDREVRRRTGGDEPAPADSARVPSPGTSPAPSATDAKSRTPPPGHRDPPTSVGDATRASRRPPARLAIGALPGGRNPHAATPCQFLAYRGSAAASRAPPPASPAGVTARSTPADSASPSHTAEDDRLLSRGPRPSATSSDLTAAGLGGRRVTLRPADPPHADLPPARRVFLDCRPFSPRVDPDAPPARLVLGQGDSRLDVASALGDDRQLASTSHWRPALRRPLQPPLGQSSEEPSVLPGSQPPPSSRDCRQPPGPDAPWSPYHTPR